MPEGLAGPGVPESRASIERAGSSLAQAESAVHSDMASQLNCHRDMIWTLAWRRHSSAFLRPPFRGFLAGPQRSRERRANPGQCFQM